MSKLIVEMEYPKNGCSECRLKYKKRGYGGVFYCFNHLCVDKWTYERTRNGDRPSWCPIICQLPNGHGRLVDADAMAKDLEYDCELDSRGLDDMNIVGHEREHLQFDKDCKQNCIWYLTEQKTIVPATEGSET